MPSRASGIPLPGQLRVASLRSCVRRACAYGALTLLASCTRTRTLLIAPLDAPAIAAADSAAITVTEPAESRREAEGPPALAMRGVDFHVSPRVVLHVRHLRGEAVATRSDRPVTFDDKRSFSIRIATADASITLPDLERLLNEYVFAYPKAPLFDLHLSRAGSRLRLTGKLRKGGDVPFEILANLSTTAAGEIRLHPSSIRVARVPAGGLLKLVGLRLDRLVNLAGSHGARAHGNDILLDVERMLPPPYMRGHVIAAQVGVDGIRLSFLDAAASTRMGELTLPETAPNYLYFRGGTVRIGKLYMVHTDLELIDDAPEDPLDFSLDEYARQLVAGYVKNTPDHGLIVHVPDLYRLSALHPDECAVGDRQSARPSRPDCHDRR